MYFMIVAAIAREVAVPLPLAPAPGSPGSQPSDAWQPWNQWNQFENAALAMPLLVSPLVGRPFVGRPFVGRPFAGRPFAPRIALDESRSSSSPPDGGNGAHALMSHNGTAARRPALTFMCLLLSKPEARRDGERTGSRRKLFVRI